MSAPGGRGGPLRSDSSSTVARPSAALPSPKSGEMESAHYGSMPVPSEPEKEEEVEEIAVRSNFDPLANFTPSVKVDKDGIARIPITIPDNLTKYKLLLYL